MSPGSKSQASDRDSVAGPNGGPVTAYDLLVAKIRDQIMSGELRPGDQLPTEPELSSHYQVSRNTAREALRALASQGLVTVKRGVSGGIFVAVPTPEQISGSLQTSLALLAENAHVPVSALVEIRQVLEVPAAEMAALRRTDEDLAAIRDSLFDPRTVDPTTVFTSNRDFHTALIKAAHNPLLELLAEPVFRVIQTRFIREHRPARFWHKVDREHREILGYVEVRDQAGARDASQAHLGSMSGAYDRMDRDRPGE